MSEALFSSSASWARHQNQHSEQTNGDLTCPFCGASISNITGDFYRHVGRHLREISLAVLPQTTFSESGEDSDSDEAPEVSPTPRRSLNNPQDFEPTDILYNRYQRPKLDTGPRGWVGRAFITQELLRASRKDCNDSRNRFLPRARLIDIINAELVKKFLQELPKSYTNDARHREHMVQLISPGPRECSCGREYCTGRRMILATLFLCGLEDLILSFLPPADHQTCDRSLPLRLDSYEDHCYGLSAEERELFIHFQWHVYTPILTVITSGEWKDVAAFPEEVSLPWMETTRVGYKEFGEVSYVERIEIHSLNHDLVSWTVQPIRDVTLNFD